MSKGEDGLMMNFWRLDAREQISWTHALRGSGSTHDLLD